MKKVIHTKKTEKLSLELGHNPIIDILVKNMPFDYEERIIEKTDKELWDEAINLGAFHETNIKY